MYHDFRRDYILDSTVWLRATIYSLHNTTGWKRNIQRARRAWKKKFFVKKRPNQRNFQEKGTDMIKEMIAMMYSHFTCVYEYLCIFLFAFFFNRSAIRLFIQYNLDTLLL